MKLIHRTPAGTPWFLKRPWGFVARARFEQIDTERRDWQRWCEEAEEAARAPAQEA